MDVATADISEILRCSDVSGHIGQTNKQICQAIKDFLISSGAPRKSNF